MLTTYKPIGISCVDHINILKEQDQYKDRKMGCSGRLDEMAHGIIIILLDDETKKIKEYHALNKAYRFRFIIGVETDTTSVLGLFQNKPNPTSNVNINAITSAIFSFNKTEFQQEYHVYSSYCPSMRAFPEGPKHKGIKKPLWWWARENRLAEVGPIDTKLVSVYDIAVKQIKHVSLVEFMDETMTNLNKITGTGLRCSEVITQWQNYYETMDKKTSFVEFECEIKVSSGFYIRQFVKDLGKTFNMDVVVTEIERIAYFE